MARKCHGSCRCPSGVKAPSDTASRVRFALTQVVLGIDLCRSAVPSYLSSCSGSTGPALRLANPHPGGNMKSRTLTCFKSMLCFVALAMPFHLTAQHTRYAVTDLGTLGGSFSFANGINNKGW